jgi:hypothetical protein
MTVRGATLHTIELAYDTDKNLDLTKRRAFQFEPDNNDVADGHISVRQNEQCIIYR